MAVYSGRRRPAGGGKLARRARNGGGIRQALAVYTHARTMFARARIGPCLTALLLGVTALASAVAASAQAPAARSERFFKLDWHVERRDGRDTAVVGQVRNDYLYSLRGVELQVQVLDASGQVTAESFGRIDRDVRPGSVAVFRVPLQETGARYTVLVHAFDFGERESP